MTPILIEKLKNYKTIRQKIVKDGNSLFDCDFELRMAIFIASYIDGNDPTGHQYKIHQEVAQFLEWTPFYEKLLIGKIEKLPEYTLEQFSIAQRYKDFSEFIYYITSLCCAVDKNELNEDQINYLETMSAQWLSHSKTHIEQWHNKLIEEYGEHLAILNKNEIGTIISDDLEDEKSLEEYLEELDTLIGLDKVKEEVHKLIDFLQIQKKRVEHELKSIPLSLHMVYTGNPGTGKTTVARLVAKILKKMGFLKKGHLVETDRSGLVGQYIGHTSKKTDEVVQRSLDGILFIDEAYSLTTGTENDFGQEAIDTLVKRMEDYRDRLIIIVAGYKDEMQDFINTNPGLRSRFNSYIEFNDYDKDQLLAIFDILCQNNEYSLDKAAERKLLSIFEHATQNKSHDFGNGRYVRNQFESIVRNQAMRLARCEALSKEELITIHEADIPSL